MQKKEILWICVLAVLAALYIHFFSHWFEKGGININATIRPNRRPGGPATIAVFTLNDSFQLTSLKVVPLEGTKYDPLATPVWHLISDSNSVPTRAIRYGQPIRGMKPALQNVHPEPLVPGTHYRVILNAGKITGSKDF